MFFENHKVEYPWTFDQTEKWRLKLFTVIFKRKIGMIWHQTYGPAGILYLKKNVQAVVTAIYWERVDLLAFFKIIPDWDTYSVGLRGVRLTQGESGFDGLYYHAGIICIPAWERDLWRFVNNRFFEEHRALYDRLGLSYEFHNGSWLLQFTENTVRAYQLLHIFLHELGHHHDRMNTRKKSHPARGEDYAEHWAFEFERKVWDGYQETFGLL